MLGALPRKIRSVDFSGARRMAGTEILVRYWCAKTWIENCLIRCLKHEKKRTVGGDATTLCFTFLHFLLLVPLFLSLMSVSFSGRCKNGHHMSQGRHSLLLRPGHDFSSSLCPKRHRW